MAGTTSWTIEGVLALAPDAASARAARSLSRRAVWSDLGATPSLVWATCQGSARDPYQVRAEPAGPVFSCTCPSRKAPCKHGLALLLLAVAGGGDPNAGAPAARGELAPVGPAGRAGRRPGSPPRGATVDPEAQARRQAARVDTMSAGLADFERWLGDLVRQGLAAARHQPYGSWDAAAARLVDAQLPGLAERVRAMGGAVRTRADWPEHLLAEAGRWYLAVRAWEQRDVLAPSVLGDLRTVLGWPRRTDEVLAGDRCRDRWTVVGLRRGADDRVQSQRTWLHGETSGELVVLLDFAAAGAVLEVPHVLGSVVDAELALYPGAPPRRGLFTGDQRVVGTTRALPGCGTVADALAQAAQRLAANPWNDRSPAALAQVVPVVDGDGAAVVDGCGERLPLAPWAPPWELLARSGGHPVDLFGEWDGEHLVPLAVVTDTGLASL